MPTNPSTPAPVPLLSSAETLHQIREREQVATKAPWWATWDEEGRPRVIHMDGNTSVELMRLTYVRDNDFVAHARQDIPFLLALVDDQAAQIAAGSAREQALRHLVETWKKIVAEEDNDDFGRERASVRSDDIEELAALLPLPAPKEPT